MFVCLLDRFLHVCLSFSIKIQRVLLLDRVLYVLLLDRCEYLGFKVQLEKSYKLFTFHVKFDYAIGQIFYHNISWSEREGDQEWGHVTAWGLVLFVFDDEGNSDKF